MVDHQNKPQKKDQTNKTFRLGMLAFVFFLLAFFCSGYVIFPFVELSINSFIELGTGLDWDRLSGFTSLVTMSLLFAGLIFGLADRIQKERITRDEKNKLKFQYFSNISDRLTDPRQEEARRWIIDTFKKEFLNEPSPEEMAAIVRKKVASKPKTWTENRTPGQIYLKMVMNNFDYIGFILEHYVEIDDSVMEWMSNPIAKVWLLVGDYIEEESKLRGERDFYDYARRLGKACVEWRKTRSLLGKFVDMTI